VTFIQTVVEFPINTGIVLTKQVIRDELNTQERSNPIAYRDGSPVFEWYFLRWTVFLNGESQGHFYLRYNVYNDQIEIFGGYQSEI
jgi:hypothetical protein